MELVLSPAQIRVRLAEMADNIAVAFEFEPILLVAILQGAERFASELSWEMDEVGTTLRHITLSSYQGMKSKGEVTHIGDNLSEKDGFYQKNILLVDDILETGETLKKAVEILRLRNPKRLRTCVLLSKPSDNPYRPTPDFVGFAVKKGEFVVGYGMDLDGKYRDLDGVFAVKQYDSLKQVEEVKPWIH